MVHTTLLSHLDVNGTQATVLAECAGITKQAAGRVIADLEREGYVQRLPDPTDQRASMIVFTDAGRQFLVDAYQVKKEYAILLCMDLSNQPGSHPWRKLLCPKFHRVRRLPTLPSTRA
ncbi:MAG: MarR family transcriptional regulator [Chloroflexota bacterium]|nr:MarR family transcriptional regulator [Chloroflexota bacterium]